MKKGSGSVTFNHVPDHHHRLLPAGLGHEHTASRTPDKRTYHTTRNKTDPTLRVRILSINKYGCGRILYISFENGSFCVMMLSEQLRLVPIKRTNKKFKGTRKNTDQLLRKGKIYCLWISCLYDFQFLSSFA